MKKTASISLNYPFSFPRKKIMSDIPIIVLRGLRLQCVIGVQPAEAFLRQEVVLDLRLRPASGPRGAIPGADYAAVTARLKVMAATERFLLLEDMAAHVADILSDEFNIADMQVRCAKPQVVPELAEAAVEIQRARKPKRTRKKIPK